MNEQDDLTRKTVTGLLKGGNAFGPLENILSGIPFELTGKIPEKLPWSIWQQVEHIRIAEWDILEFCRNPEYKEPDWPEEFWPEIPVPPGFKSWKDSLEAVKDHRDDMISLVNDKSYDLWQPFTHGMRYTLLREAQLMAEHNAYHSGQIVLLRRLLGAW